MIVFLKDLPIYYINLKERVDRNNYFLKQVDEYAIKEFYRIDAISKQNVLAEKYNMKKQDIACSTSHMIALQKFIEGEKDFAIICEDDIDLSNLTKINFSFVEQFGHLKDSFFCLQTSIATRTEIEINFKIHPRSFWDFGTMSYIINRKYAKLLLEKYFINNKESFYNFEPKTIKDARGGEIITRPVADEIIYSLTQTMALPLFTYIVTRSDMVQSKEYYDQFIKGRSDFIEYWSKFNEISYTVLEEENGIS
jgi:hypothetical protein